MGIITNQLGVILSHKESIKGKDVLAISVQFPPLIDQIKRFHQKFPTLLSQNDFQKLKKTTQSNFQKTLFLEILEAKSINSIEISNEEGAEYIWNLNHDLDSDKAPEEMRNLGSSFDYIFEGGTMEHVSNNAIYLKNIFFLLRQQGLYCLNLPTSGYQEHGFFQYSPTFFSDLCHGNNSSLSLKHLSVSMTRNNCKALMFDKFYKETPFNFPPSCASKNSYTFYSSTFQPTSLVTGTLLNLVNASGKASMVLAVIQKNKDFSFSLDFSQSVYRNVSLSSVVGSGEASVGKSAAKNRNLKSFILGFPLPSLIKFKLITYALKILGHKAPKKNF
ncbi:hypothetical protein N9D54_02530 [Gammaproteobacteria bacterium]|jgi:hypothetical protein|nr:hypothetical protein [Gammaproteobacteria bacterium]